MDCPLIYRESHSLCPLSPCCLVSNSHILKLRWVTTSRKTRLSLFYPICSMHRKPVAQPQDSESCRVLWKAANFLFAPSAILPSLQINVKNILLLFFPHLNYVLVSRKISPQQSFLQMEVHFSSHFLGQCWQTRKVVGCFMSWKHY